MREKKHSEMKILGSRSQFAIEIGENQNNETNLRYVDVWAASQLLTVVDNLVYVPQFCGSVSSDLSFLLSKLDYIEEFKRPFAELTIEDNFQMLNGADAGEPPKLFNKYRIMDWGPTSDDVLMFLFIESGVCYLPFMFNHQAHSETDEASKIFVVEILLGEFLQILHEAIFELAYNWGH